MEVSIIVLSRFNANFPTRTEKGRNKTKEEGELEDSIIYDDGVNLLKL